MNLFSTIDDTVDNLDRPLYFGGPFDRKWYHIFPTITRGPSADMFIEETPIDPVLRNEMEDGTVLTRMRFTTVPRLWNVAIEELLNADKVTLDDFQRNEVMFSTQRFKWHNTQNDTEYWVHFFEPIRFSIKRRDQRNAPDRWMAEFRLYED